MLPSSAISKGKALEDFIVDELRSSGLDKRAYRQRGSGNGLNKGDVWNDLGICFEAKNTHGCNPKKIMEQATREGLGTQEPVGVWHPPHKPLEESLVIINWKFFLKLLKKEKNTESQVINPDKQTAWKIKTLISSAKAVLKEIDLL